MHGLGQVRQCPWPRRIVGQTPDVWIVDAVLLRSQLDEFRRPRLIRQAAGQIHTDVAYERRTTQFSTALDGLACVCLALAAPAGTPNTREVRLPVRQSRRRRRQIVSTVGLSRHALSR